MFVEEIDVATTPRSTPWSDNRDRGVWSMMASRSGSMIPRAEEDGHSERRRSDEPPVLRRHALKRCTEAYRVCRRTCRRSATSSIGSPSSSHRELGHGAFTTAGSMAEEELKSWAFSGKRMKDFIGQLGRRGDRPMVVLFVKELFATYLPGRPDQGGRLRIRPGPGAFRTHGGETGDAVLREGRGERRPGR